MIIVASASPFVMSQFQEHLQAFGLVITVTDYGSLEAAATKLKPRYIFIDLTIPGFTDTAHLVQLRARSSRTKVIAIGTMLPDEVDVGLFTVGVSGYCDLNAGYHYIARMMTALEKGEIWISRSAISRLVGALQSLPYPSLEIPHDWHIRISGLTQRESEIAMLVGKGNSNRQIAQILNISERTVKAHLTEIFKKMGVSDRLSLALNITSPPSGLQTEAKKDDCRIQVPQLMRMKA